MARAGTRSRRTNDDEEVIGGTKRTNHFLNFAKFAFTAAAGAVVGYFAVEHVRKIREPKVEEKAEEPKQNPEANQAEIAKAMLFGGAGMNPFATPPSPPVHVNVFGQGAPPPFPVMQPPPPPQPVAPPPPPQPPGWAQKPKNPLESFVDFDED